MTPARWHAILTQMQGVRTVQIATNEYQHRTCDDCGIVHTCRRVASKAAYYCETCIERQHWYQCTEPGYKVLVRREFGEARWLLEAGLRERLLAPLDGIEAKL